MPDPIIIGQGSQPVSLLPKMANRHGLIAGATGTGRRLHCKIGRRVQPHGRAGFPFGCEGDLSGISQPGTAHPKIQERVEHIGLTDFQFRAFPVTFWDVMASRVIRSAPPSPIWALLLSRLLNLNETQQAFFTLVFRVADDNGWLLLDLKDLRSMLQFVAENANDFRTLYGNISAASVGAIQRRLLTLEEQGGTDLFGEPALNLRDMMQTDESVLA